MVLVPNRYVSQILSVLPTSFVIVCGIDVGANFGADTCLRFGAAALQDGGGADHPPPPSPLHGERG